VKIYQLGGGVSDKDPRDNDNGRRERVWALVKKILSGRRSKGGPAKKSLH